VAPCYPGGFMALTLKDPENGIATVFVDESLEMRSLETSATAEMAPVVERKSVFRISPYGPVVKPGEYDVYVSVGRRDGTPVIALPYENDDGGRRYRVGRITVR
ncbi:MAG: hypothetical protein Q4C47_00585, partial [Planctomycetia bacterium]|nr:hypothetical protein [Planctomycetia bacterium]